MSEIWEPKPEQSKMALRRCDFVDTIINDILLSEETPLQGFIETLVVSCYWQGATDATLHHLEKKGKLD